jgi:hypothetical protein
MKRYAIATLIVLMLSGCDQVKQRLGMPDPAVQAAEGNAIGSACRHAGRGLEDCYRLNPAANKASVYAGWKEMNEYMLKNNMQAVAPVIPVDDPDPGAPAERKPRKKLKEHVIDENLVRDNLARDNLAREKMGAAADAQTTDDKATANAKKPETGKAVKPPAAGR